MRDKSKNCPICNENFFPDFNKLFKNSLSNLIFKISVPANKLKINIPSSKAASKFLSIPK